MPSLSYQYLTLILLVCTCATTLATDSLGRSQNNPAPLHHKNLLKHRAPPLDSAFDYSTLTPCNDASVSSIPIYIKSREGRVRGDWNWTVKGRDSLPPFAVPTPPFPIPPSSDPYRIYYWISDDELSRDANWLGHVGLPYLAGMRLLYEKDVWQRGQVLFWRDWAGVMWAWGRDYDLYVSGA